MPLKVIFPAATMVMAACAPRVGSILETAKIVAVACVGTVAGAVSIPVALSTVPQVGVQVTLFVVAVASAVTSHFRSVFGITTPIKSSAKNCFFSPVASVAVVGTI